MPDPRAMRTDTNRGRLLVLIAQRGEITTEEAAGILKLPDDAAFSNAQNGLYYGGLILLGSRARGSIMALSALGRERLQAVEKKKLKGKTAWERLGEL
jgi:hypothetical protein